MRAAQLVQLVDLAEAELGAPAARELTKGLNQLLVKAMLAQDLLDTAEQFMREDPPEGTSDADWKALALELIKDMTMQAGRVA
jgi:hypothetical protein